ncbi:MarR family transcriptional regulator [Pseudofrankia asymbiotica]|uniref:MarR family transcriptional regulator n=1 Tax=Pseudofrankia asymbiotica TaxID=1834516 RepID=A0A1V2IIE9_9ACTN|nr:MarR family transcriptional regulator [Pseudofrankia asymbiotica]
MRGLAGWLVNKTAVHSHRLNAEAFTAVGSRRFHYALLASLDEFGSSSQADLGRRCGYDRSDVAAMVNELVQAGHVERAQDPADRRRNIIAITPAGRAWLARLDVVAADLQDAFLAPLDARERAELIRLLTRVLEHHTALHGFARDPNPSTH